jgi:UDP-glucuronate decarboxylase
MNRHRTLVTGSAGILGSQLCERLLDCGEDVPSIDNYYPGTRDSIGHLLDHPQVALTRHDVTFALCVEFDHTFNLAGPASPIY